MEYKEKYINAFNRAKKLKETCSNQAVVGWCEYIFPELVENKDEKIRKALIRFHKSTIDVDGIKGEDIIAWLENQKSVAETVKKCKDSWYNEGKIAGQAEGLTDDEKYQQGWHDALEKQSETFSDINTPSKELIFSIWDLGNKWKEITKGRISPEHGTQLEYIQKHWKESEYYLKRNQDENEVSGEPKFKVGDLIVTDYCKGKVIALTDDAYLLDTEQGIPFSCEHNAHLWSINDAKDGDILYYYGSKAGNYRDSIFIFDGLDNWRFEDHDGKRAIPTGYCCITFLKNNFLKFDYSGPDLVELDFVKPATKEQSDIFFTNLKEAGYEWDAENKILKNIENYYRDIR